MIVQILLVLLTLIVSEFDTKMESKNWIDSYFAVVSLRSAAFVHIQSIVPLAVDVESGSGATKWRIAGNARHRNHRLHIVLCRSARVQFPRLRTVRQQCRSAICRRVLDVEHFRIHLRHRCLRLLRARKISAWICRHRYVFDAAAVAAGKWKYVRPSWAAAQLGASNILLFSADSITVSNCRNMSRPWATNKLAKFRFSTFYNKLKATLQKPLQQANGPQKCHESGIEVNGKFFEQNLQQIAQANTTINRFLSAFIDHVCLHRAIVCFFLPCGRRANFSFSITFYQSQ